MHKHGKTLCRHHAPQSLNQVGNRGVPDMKEYCVLQVYPLF